MVSESSINKFIRKVWMKKLLIVLGMTVVSSNVFANPQEIMQCQRTLSQSENKIYNLQTQLNHCLSQGQNRPSWPQAPGREDCRGPGRDTKEEERLRDELRRERQNSENLSRDTRRLEDEVRRLNDKIRDLERQSSYPGNGPVRPGQGNGPVRPGHNNGRSVIGYSSIATCLDTATRNADLRYAAYGTGTSKTDAESSAVSELRRKYNCGVGVTIYRTEERYSGDTTAQCTVACLDSYSQKVDLRYSTNATGTNELNAIVKAANANASQYNCGYGMDVVRCN